MITIGKCIFSSMMIVSLAGCSSTSGDTNAENMMVDPGKYELFSCRNLSTTLVALKKRELDLQQLMEKASSSPGGEFVNLISYRSEYLQAKGDQSLVLKKQREKNCDKESVGYGALDRIH